MNQPTSASARQSASDCRLVASDAREKRLVLSELDTDTIKAWAAVAKIELEAYRAEANCLRLAAQIDGELRDTAPSQLELFEGAKQILTEAGYRVEANQ